MSTTSVLESLLGISSKNKPNRNAHVLTHPIHRQEGGGKQAMISTTATKSYSLAVLRKQNPFRDLITVYFMEKNDCFTVQTKK